MCSNYNYFSSKVGCVQSALDDGAHINVGVPAIAQTAESSDDEPDEGIWNTLQSIYALCVQTCR